MITGPNALSGTVGRGGVNRTPDVAKVVEWFGKILPAQGGAKLVNPSPVDLGMAIENFQRLNFLGRNPREYDGRIDPNFNTHKRLIALAGGIVPPVAAVASTFTTGFYQGDYRWKQMRLNNGNDTVWSKGCLLSCMASGFNWRGVRVPPGVQAQVRAVIDAQVNGDTTKGRASLPELKNLDVTGPLTPGVFNAWMTAASVGGMSGFSSTFSSDLNAGNVGVVLKAAGYGSLQFIGQFSPDPPAEWLRFPDPDTIARWLAGGRVLIAHLEPIATKHANHWVLLTGFDASDYSFKCWDVGYPPDSDEHTEKLYTSQMDRLNHFGSITGWQ